MNHEIRPKFFVFGTSIAVFGWLLTYLLPLALIANDTVNQGDDSAWAFGFFVLGSTIFLGLCLLFFANKYLYFCRGMSLFHIISIILGGLILPKYWQYVTFASNHIAAGMDIDYINRYEPEAWHPYWAPLMSFFILAILYLGYLSWKRK